MDIDTIIAEYKEKKTENIGLEITLQELKNYLKEPLDRSARKILETKKKGVEKQIREIDYNILNILHTYVNKIIIVPGDEEKFKQLTGISVEVVDLGNYNKGAVVVENIPAQDPNYAASIFDYTKTRQLIDNGIIGIINVQYIKKRVSNYDSGIEMACYGLPVRKIEPKQGE